MKRYRGKRSQMAVAAALGVHVAAVGQWERGVNTPRRDTAERLDVELGAHGAVLEAFGYVSPPGESESRGLADRVAALERKVSGLIRLAEKSVGVSEVATAILSPADPTAEVAQQ